MRSIRTHRLSSAPTLAVAALLATATAACDDYDGDDIAVQERIDEGEALGATINQRLDAELAGMPSDDAHSAALAVGDVLHEAELLHAEVALDRATSPEV